MNRLRVRIGYFCKVGNGIGSMWLHPGSNPLKIVLTAQLRKYRHYIFWPSIICFERFYIGIQRGSSRIEGSLGCVRTCNAHAYVRCAPTILRCHCTMRRCNAVRRGVVARYRLSVGQAAQCPRLKQRLFQLVAGGGARCMYLAHAHAATLIKLNFCTRKCKRGCTHTTHMLYQLLFGDSLCTCSLNFGSVRAHTYVSTRKLYVQGLCQLAYHARMNRSWAHTCTSLCLAIHTRCPVKRCLGANKTHVAALCHRTCRAHANGFVRLGIMRNGRCKKEARIVERTYLE